ncbi:MAG: outer membrane lipoprotein chaperone LolA [Gammaproteobacteria bacterium]|nr:outer membrane lipoprotein chaperone LolA [Gammaproteobacteria bacterium]
MKKLLTLLTFTTLFSGAGITSLAQDEVVVNDSNAEAALKLALILQEMDTLSADVEQLTLDQDGREIQEFQAKLIIDKPDHFYWEIQSPYSESIIANGNRIWRIEPDLEQVTVEEFQNDAGRNPLLLLNGDAELLAGSYTIAAAELELGNRQRFILTPTAPDSQFERLSLTFAENVIQEMQFESSLGQKTSLSFSNPEINAVIDPEIFEFHMPEGMEIIDNTGD